MQCGLLLRHRGKRSGPVRNSERGVTLIELLIVAAIIAIMSGMSVPVIQQTLASYRLGAGIAAISGAIQTTRYQAISNGYPFRVAFSKTNLTYQVSTCGTGYDPSTMTPDTCTYSNIGSAVPLEGSSGIQLGADITLQFSPGGRGTVSSGSLPLSVSSLNGGGTVNKTKTIMVSTYGNVKVQ
jgi:prepilin-type N-terminal cleavage/methylation domain-containing protein